MALVERENGSISDSVVDDNLVLTVTVDGVHEIDSDFLDRVLQFVLMELKVPTQWKSVPPITMQALVHDRTSDTV